MTLLDELFPEYDVRERHARQISAPPERVFKARRTANLADSTTTRLLFATSVPSHSVSVPKTCMPCLLTRSLTTTRRLSRRTGRSRWPAGHATG